MAPEDDSDANRGCGSAGYDARDEARSQPSTVTAPLTEKARSTRAALVESATALFVEKGYGAVSVRDLARRTQMTSGAIYGQFRNKADLLVAAIAEHIAMDLEEPSSRRAADFRASITQQWRTYRSRRGMRALLVEGAAAARIDPEVRSQLNELQAARIADWKGIYHEIQEHEDIDADVDMNAVLIMLWATELGLGVLESWDIELPRPGVWGQLAERVLASLDAPSNGAGSRSR
jgi:AcrR family transcriptional regulator